jgi:peptide chain release factor 2
MITQEQFKGISQRLEKMRAYLSIDDKRRLLHEEDIRTQDPSFWDDPKKAEEILKALILKPKLTSILKELRRGLKSWNSRICSLVKKIN